MKTKVESVSDVVKKVFVDYTTKEVAPHYEKIMKDFKNTVSIPGFRKGKVPVSVIEKRFKQEIMGELIREITKDSYEDILKKNKDKLGKVLFEEIFEFDLQPDKSIKLGLYLEVAPNLELTNIEELEAEIPEIKEDLDEGVENALKELQTKNIKFKPSRRKVCKKNDIVDVSLKAVDENDNVIKNEDNIELELGTTGYLEKIAKHFVGVKTGEDANKFEVTFEDNPEYGEFKGKKVTFTIAIKVIKDKVVAPLDDDFAKEMGSFDTLDDLKADIKANLEKRMKDIEKSEKQKAIVDKLINTYEFDAPPHLATEETKKMVQDYFNQLSQYGIKPETDQEKIEAIYKQYEESAKKRVKTSIILGQIAEANKVEALDSDIDSEIAKMAAAYGDTVDAEMLKKMLEERGEMSNMKNYILQEKTFDLLLAKANFSVKKPEKAKKKTKKESKTGA